MSACRVCMAMGHEAIKLPSGRHVCPLKLDEDPRKGRVVSFTEFTEAKAVRDAIALAEQVERDAVIEYLRYHGWHFQADLIKTGEHRKNRF